jgi:hypothetical protein
MAGSPDMPDNILMSHEAHFYLHSVINKQKHHYWVTEKLHELSEPPLYGAWCHLLQSLDFFLNKDE